MIIFRVGIASDKTLSGNTTQQASTAEPSSERTDRTDRNLFPLGRVRNHNAYEMKSIAVEIRQYRESDADQLSMSVPDVECSAGQMTKNTEVAD